MPHPRGPRSTDTNEREHTERQLLVSRVKALAEALEGSNIADLELTENGTRILIRRRSAGSHQVTQQERSAPARRLRPRSTQNTSAVAAPAPDPTVAVVAPLTGVFYGSPSPTSSAFVQVGDTIQAGQVVCIIEAMKVFNEIKAEISGVVTAILPKSGQLVQKGDALIRVKPV